MLATTRSKAAALSSAAAAGEGAPLPLELPPRRRRRCSTRLLCPAADPPSPDLPWPEFATPFILALLTGEERKPLREACRAGRDAVDAGITRLGLETLRVWGDGQAPAPWTGVPLDAIRLPALRHLDLDLDSGYSYSSWNHRGAAHMRGAARLVAAHAASLRTLRLRFCTTSQPESHRELSALEVGFLESVLLATPLPALRRLDLFVYSTPNDDARCLEALRCLARLSLPRLTRLSLSAWAATGQGVRWLEGAHLPALRHLGVIDYSASTGEQPCVAALAAPRWSALEALELFVRTRGDGMAALSTALAPTLRRLSMNWWPFGTEGCAEEWHQLRSLELAASDTLAERLGSVRLPRLERLAVRGGDSAAVFLDGFASLRASIPALQVVELDLCFSGNYGCPVVGCTDPETVELLAELRAAWPGLEVRRFEEDDWTQA